MSPIQQMLLGAGAVAEKSYVDDIFSTYVYKGTGSAVVVNNGMKLGNAGVGSMIQSANSGANGLEISDSNDFQFYNGDFTFECFFKYNDNGDDTNHVYQQRDNSTDPWISLWFAEPSGNDAKINFAVAGISGQSNAHLEATATNIRDKNWHHVAATRSGNAWRLFYDGSEIDSLTYSYSSIGNSSADPKIFMDFTNTSNETFRGFLSNFRIVKGTAVYTSNFTPPTAELTAITNTVLLLGVGSTPAVDASGQNHSISTAGTVDSFTSGGPLTSSEAGLGGLVWIKSRTSTQYNNLIDTVRGPTKAVFSNHGMGEDTGTNGYMTSFNNSGFTTGNYGNTSQSNQDFTSWSFAKAKGFFTIKEYSGSNSAQTLSHDLGCVPGLILVKRTDTTGDWMVYHRSLGAGKYAKFNTTAQGSAGSVWNSTSPTSTTFTVEGNNGFVNTSGGTYIAYIFAGGESTAATARSVDFDGSNDYLALPNHSDLDLGNSDFTLEAWIKPTDPNNYQYIYSAQDNGLRWYWRGDTKKLYFAAGDASGDFLTVTASESPDVLEVGQWYHVAVTRSSNVFRLFLNGIQYKELTHTNTFKSPGSTAPNIGRYAPATNNYFNGSISNLRLVKGTAVYTSSFRTPTEPLTNITNTKLLCCNDSSAAGSTVTPGTITNNGATASSDSPFDDPAGFAFGENKEGIIKCGSYIGNGSQTGPEIDLGWEPQWLLCKKIDNQGGGASTSNWHILDSLRGTASGGAGVADDQLLMPNLTNTEVTIELADFTSTGFKNTSNRDAWNQSGDEYLYVAIRRPDGYVGKPPELGTGVFAIDTGDTQTTIPNYDSGFPVDFALLKNPGTATSWDVTARLTGTKYLKTDSTTAEANFNDYTFDSNTGWAKDNGPGTMQSWMWKRHAGFDVVAANPQTGVAITHSLGKTPEMIWAKDRDQNAEWSIYHKNLNGGTNPEQYRLKFTDDIEQDTANAWNDTAPTATYFTTGSWMNGNDMIFMLFSSISGISKVGSYTGNGVSGLSVTTGFQPRFVILKRRDSATEGDWYVYDTTRNWVSLGSNSQRLQLNNDDAQANCGTCVEPTSTGFNLGSSGRHNTNNGKYIYYAHS